MIEALKPSKVFGIGLNKTGTTTLAKCCSLLGYRGTSYDRKLLEEVQLKDDFSRIEQIVEQHDLFEDWPWPLIYEQMDKRFPGSKFILTVRKDSDTWLNSLKHHSMRTHPLNHSRKVAYGYNYPHGHEAEHLKFYNQHNQAIRSYFKDRRNDFIELCWETGDGWKELCTFLGVPVPDLVFPHANRGSEKKIGAVRFFINAGLSTLNRGDSTRQ